MSNKLIAEHFVLQRGSAFFFRESVYEHTWSKKKNALTKLLCKRRRLSLNYVYTAGTIENKDQFAHFLNDVAPKLERNIMTFREKAVQVY